MMSIPAVLINIVLYHPDKNKLLDLIDVCSQYENAKILLFDNSETRQSLDLILTHNLVLFQSQKNVGVAGAHYAACEMAEAENFDFVLFLDQDSQLPPDFIKAMLSEFYRLQKSHPRLCAIGPTWKDPRLFDWQQAKKLKNKRRTRLKEKLRVNLRLKNILISSGMLIFVHVLNNIGYPKKEYFIDLVDTEWCLRALYKNYQVLKLADIHIQHTIGEVKITRKSFLQYQAPIRYYYSIRNSFYLFSEKKISLALRIFLIVRNILEIRKIPFLPKPLASLIAAVCGLKDGFFKKNVSL